MVKLAIYRNLIKDAFASVEVYEVGYCFGSLPRHFLSVGFPTLNRFCDACRSFVVIRILTIWNIVVVLPVS